MEMVTIHRVRPAAAMFKIAPSTLQTWRKTDFSLKRTPGAGHPVSYTVDLDQKIAEWIHVQRDLQIPVSIVSVMNYAYSLVNPVNPEFKASRGWVFSFFLRHNLSLRAKTSMSQKLLADLEKKIENFHSFVKNLRIDIEAEEGLIINMDETPMYFDIVPGRTVDTKGTKTVKVRMTGAEKRHITVVLAVSNNGNVLPLMIIFKGKRELKLDVPRGYVVCVQEKGWVDEPIMLRWVNEIFRRYTKRKPSIIVLDSFRAHLTDTVKLAFRRVNAAMAVIPGGCTSKLQPLDVVINKPFKDILRKTWEGFIRESVLAMEKDDSIERLRPVNKQTMVTWIKNATSEIASNREMVKKTFVVTGISPRINGADDHLVRSDELCNELTAGYQSNDEDGGFLGFTEDDLHSAQVAADRDFEEEIVSVTRL